jgi:membrane protein implicated in regulation of membrane protease activity
MLDGRVGIVFFDAWAWLFFIGVGLVFIILELLLGINTGLDLVFIGTAFVLGGLITFVLQSWAWTAIVSGVICVAYVVIGRRYIHNKTAVKGEKTNIDTITGKTGVVEQDIEPDKDGLVKVGYEKWRARSAENIKAGEEITVTGISGVTVNVKRTERGNK